MNSKIVLAFFAGAVLASGIVYMAVQNEHPATPARLASAPVKPIYIDPEPAREPAIRPVVDTQEAPGEVSRDQPLRKLLPDRIRPDRVQREKPSPIPPPRNNEVARVVRPDPSAARLEAPQVQERPVHDVPVAPPSASTPPQAAPPQAVTPQPPPPTPEPPRESAPAAPPVPEAAQPHTVSITAGTILPVRIGETITADRNQPGDTFLATLDKPLIVDGFVIAERGARVEGRIVEAQAAGRVKGLSHLTVELVKLSTADGQHVRIRTAAFQKEGQSSVGSDAAKVGIGAAIGAAIGGMAGGGKGAGIGAGVGGAAGAGDVLLTRGKAASIPVETRISFRLQEPVTITERLQ